MSNIKKLLSYLWQKPEFTLGGLAGIILGTICYSVTPYFTAWFTEIATTQNYGQFPHAITLTILLLLGNVIFFAIGEQLSSIAMANTSKAVMLDVMKHLHQLDFAFHTNKNSGKILALINRGDDAIYVFLDVFFVRIIELFVGIVVILISFSSLDFKYALLVLGSIFIEGGLAFHFTQINMKRRSVMNKADNELSAAKVDNLLNFETVKYFAQEKFELKRLEKITEKVRQAVIDFCLSLRYIDLSTNGTNVLFILAITIILAVDLMSGQINAPQFVFVFTFALTLNWRMANFIDAGRQIAKKYEDLNQYLDLLNAKVEITELSHPQKIAHLRGEIKFEDVSFIYGDGKEEVIKDFNLTIKPGEVVAIVGQSGAGKSTITKLLMRMFDVTHGAISIDGLDIRRMSKEYLRKLIGIVPQEPMLFNKTIAENIAYANPTASDREIKKAAAAAGAADFIATSTPQGYDSVVGERGIKLSGGQKQRLAIARMILADPKIVIFDEATSALDSVSEKIVQEAFWKMVGQKKRGQKKISGIMIAHRLSTVKQAHRIVVMNDGQIAEIGTHSQLMRRKNSLYRQMWELQQEGSFADGEENV